jgi:predicted AAA+ superfamily ATPase
MLSRHGLPDLIAWARQPKRKPMILRGARQVGKTTCVELMAAEMGFNCVTVNLERRPELAELFKSNEPTRIIQLISLQFNQPILPNQSVLFLDEIQAAPEVLASLRYFYEELPELHVLCAGSLLEFALEELTFSMPVGRIEYFYLGPMTFDEFLVALGEQGLLDFLLNYHLKDELPLPIHEKLLALLKIYLITGGMPEAVQAYVLHQDFMMIERVKRSILDTYQDDFSKYSTVQPPHLLRSIFEKIPGLIAQQIKYSQINPDIKSTIISRNIRLLAMAKIITLVYHSASNGVPLGAQINEKLFKLIFLDAGLLSTQLGLSFLDLHNCAELNFVHGGMLAEQFIGQHLLYMKPYYEPPHLYYWRREMKSSQAEIDYVISHRQKIIPIEVKAGKSGTLKSLHLFMEEKGLSLGVKFSSQQPSSITNAQGSTLLSLPLYMVGQLQRLLSEA